MPRRAAYTKVEKVGQIRPDHVKGMGDVVFRGFQCPNGSCTAWIFLRRDELIEIVDFECPRCRTHYRTGDTVPLYQYRLLETATDEVVERGNFELLIDDYVDEAGDYKYCIICYAMKPLHLFDRHGARASGRQGECTQCKGTYNSIKNQTRIADQHREAAQKRRLYVDLSKETRVDSRAVRKRFNNRCFNCEIELGPNEGHLDHTLPVVYLWPMTTEDATLLCAPCNERKSGGWPGLFYADQKLRRLAQVTGHEYRLLKGPPTINPAALARLADPNFVDALFVRYANYPDELIRLRNRVLAATGQDFFAVARGISPRWAREADARRRPT